ncbi:catalase family peroxidase [Pseudomonas sp. NPDC096950]|uniref:catalase family peroxidase n=1 Tax=Pseudomonas sp. NPDC096950 TaxID=3364485 RepID=UPI00383AB59C
MTDNKIMRIAATVVASVIVLVCCGAAVVDPDWPTGLLPTSPSARQMVDEFEAVSGPHPGFRRNHAKGMCVSGQFESNGNAATYSKASFFKPGTYPVIGRLSIIGGDPAINDARGNLRSLALQMSSDGRAWKTSMNSIPVFPVNTPEALFEQLSASVPDKNTGRTDPMRVQAFRDQHPETQAFREWLDKHPPSSGYDNGTYYSVNAFRFVDEQGQTNTVRWSMEPETPYAPQFDGSASSSDPDKLSYSLASRLEQAPVRWHLIITLAEPGDPSADATRLWPAERRRIDAGVLVIDTHQSQVDGPCRDIDFNPLVLPAGIEPSDDPLLLARAAAYAESRNRRLRESRSPQSDHSKPSAAAHFQAYEPL